MRYQGKLADWNDERGFGFIAPLDGGARVFAHISAFSCRNRRPIVGDLVDFLISSGRDGRACAADIAIKDMHIDRSKATLAIQNVGSIRVAIAAAFVALVAALVYARLIPEIVLWVYLGMSVAAFVAYFLDKSAAKKGRWRTQESTLHVMALIGGWPGALTAQAIFRHKTRKRSFQIVFWATVVVNLTLVVWLLYPLE